MHIAVEGQCGWYYAVKRVARSLKVKHVIIVMHSHNRLPCILVSLFCTSIHAL